ncbi:hypothetical protein [Dietzia alimentaria]|uniref:hypothetical protein n=1 Tax=Dietzia alimentaria TaxID=665550 RepID=UPI00029ABD44|nr:hypothetical protein [Dietzia alimentaria]
MSRGFTTEIVILKALETVDEFGSGAPSPDWTLPPEKVPVGFYVSVQPLTSSEGPVERPQVVTGWQLITPPGRDLPLRSVDRVRTAAGQVFAVVGDVLRFPHPIKPNGVHHVEVMLERVSG